MSWQRWVASQHRDFDQLMETMQLSSALRLGVYLLLKQVSQPWDPKEAFSRRWLLLTGVTWAAVDRSPCWVLGAFHVALFMRIWTVFFSFFWAVLRACGCSLNRQYNLRLDPQRVAKSTSP